MAKKNKGPKPIPAGPARKVARFVGGVETPGSLYKGTKRFALDHGASREAATAAGVVGSAIPPVGLAGAVNHGIHAAKEGVIPASRATNNPKTQKTKNAGGRPIPAVMNHTMGRTTVKNRRAHGSHGKKQKH